MHARDLAIVSLSILPSPLAHFKWTQVFVRVRPCNANETAEGASGSAKVADAPDCVQVVGESSVVASMAGKEPKRFTFDKVLPNTASQFDVFEGASLLIELSCRLFDEGIASCITSCITSCMQLREFQQ